MIPHRVLSAPLTPSKVGGARVLDRAHAHVLDMPECLLQLREIGQFLGHHLADTIPLRGKEDDETIQSTVRAAASSVTIVTIVFIAPRTITSSPPPTAINTLQSRVSV